MAHTRQDTLTPPPEWWKHLRPYNKRRVAKRERQAAKEQADQEVQLSRHQIEAEKS